MYQLALTGSIASGKTAASDYFKQLGIEVIDTDVIAKELVKPNSPCLEKIKQHFGANIIQTDGSLNRKALRQIIFNNPDEKHWLESLLHPKIREKVTLQVQQATSPYVVLVIPLLFENKQHYPVDRILLIDVDKQTQLKRLCARDGLDIATAKNIIKQQASREQNLSIADDVVSNTGELKKLHQQLDQLHLFYLQESSNKN